MFSLRTYFQVLTVLIFFLNSKVDARLISTPPHEQIYPQNINYDHILSTDESYRMQICNYVKAFPKDQYDVYLVPDLGAFFIDRIDDGIKNMLKREEKWEPHIEPLLKKYTKPGTVAIDIGGHIGTQTIVLARAVGPSGKVIVFEPQLKFFRELVMNCELNGAQNVYYFWCALMDKPGTIKLPNLKKDCEVVHLYDFRLGDSGLIAPVITLDSLELTNVSMIKIDVDGLEDNVLEGARNTILANRPVILIEIQGGSDIDTAPPEILEKIVATKKILSELGYSLHKIYIHDYLALPNEE
jgi:FkbM family methyltransferase